MNTRLALALFVALTAVGCGSTRAIKGDGRFSGLGTHTRPVTTKVPAAQALFDQGLAFLYAFNHDEAIRAFGKAAVADPRCAMAWWGIALANGPHINNPAMDAAHSKAAWAALVRAREHAASSSPVERDLIAALGKRYADPAPADRAPLDHAYAEAMRTVRTAHSDDADVGALFAEALMDLRPWDLWGPDGAPQPGTPEIVDTLERVLATAPEHPLALHLYIHAVEASPDPGRADAAADRLRSLAPGLGHLVHMPSHIDVRRGRWSEAVIANRRAIEVDDEYRRLAPDQGFYHVYMAHNRHMLAYASMMRGQASQATVAITEMLAKIPDDFALAAAPVIDGFYAMPFELHLRFGRWDAMLAESEPRETFPLSRALWRCARGIAWAAKRDVTRAREEQAEFATARARVPNDSTFGNNPSARLLDVAAALLDGEISYREGKVDLALAALAAAVAAEDALRYDEPPDWILPTRHVLGAALLDAGRPAEAEVVYRQDLERLPENGWSLLGLARSLEAQGKKADDVRRRFDAVWKDSDVVASSSCMCLPDRR